MAEPKPSNDKRQSHQASYQSGCSSWMLVAGNEWQARRSNILVSITHTFSMTLDLKLSSQEARSWWQRRTTSKVLLLDDSFREFLARGEAHTLFGGHLHGLTTLWIDASACRTCAKYKGMSSLWDLLHTIKQPEEPREIKHTGEKSASQAALSQ